MFLLPGKKKYHKLQGATRGPARACMTTRHPHNISHHHISHSGLCIWVLGLREGRSCRVGPSYSLPRPPYAPRRIVQTDPREERGEAISHTRRLRSPIPLLTTTKPGHTDGPKGWKGGEVTAQTTHQTVTLALLPAGEGVGAVPEPLAAGDWVQAFF